MEFIFFLNIWKCFVNEGVFEFLRLNDIIVKLWYCCKSVDVNFYLDKGRLILRNEDFYF